MRAFPLVLLLAGCHKDASSAARGDAEGEGAFKNADGIEIVECNDRFRACGGDPVGSWEVYAVCDPGIGGDLLDGVCDALEYTVTEDRSTGTVELGADGAYDRVYKFDVDYDVFVPDRCLGPLSCSLLADVSGPLLKRCRNKPKGCDCNGTFKATFRSEGTWERKGEAIVTDDGRTEFCVEGDLVDTRDEDGVRVLWRR